MSPKFLPSTNGNFNELGSVKNLIMFNQVGAFMGILTHFLFLFFFALANIPELVYTNVISILLWSWAMYENQQANLTRAALIAMFEICAHTLIATYYVGSQVGFHLYLWPLIAWMVLNTAFRLGQILALASLASIIIFVNRADLLHDAKYTLDPVFFDVAFTFNTAGAILSLLVTTALIRIYLSEQRKELSDLAIKDPLTHLHNRLYLSSFLSQYKEKAKREKEPFCIVMSDLDHFKEVNDKYGHDKGDEVLIRVADYLERELRAQDLIVRWGGEEFLILLINCSIEQAYDRIELLRKGLHDSVHYDTTDGIQDLSMSFGIAISNGAEPIDNVISRADRMMYRAKLAGRNCVIAEH